MKSEVPEAELVNEIPKNGAGRKRLYPWQTWIDWLAEKPESKLKVTFTDEEKAQRFERSQSTARPLGLRLTRRGTSVYISLRKAPKGQP